MRPRRIQMGEHTEEQDKRPQVIQVTQKDRGVTQFTINPSQGEKIILVLEDTSSDISI